MVLPELYQNRILETAQGTRCIDDGWIPSDLHVHSSCSHDVLPTPHLHPEAIYQTAYNKNLGYISITDHDTMAAYDIIGWERERLVPGVELTLYDPVRVGHTIHVNVYQLNRSQFSDLKQITQIDRNIETFVEYLKDQNLFYTYNHPFWFIPREKPNYRAVEDIIEFFPVIEYNMKRVRRKNFIAMWLASKYKKGIIASTDTHIGKIGDAYTLSQGNTFEEYFTNIARRNAYIVPQDLNLQSLNNEIAQWIDILLHLEEVKDEKSRYTGIRVVDALINFLARNTYHDYPRFYATLEFVTNEFLNTCVFSYCYLFSQNYAARKIGNMLEIPDFA